MRLLADTAICVGAGMCVLTAPAVFDQDDEHGTVLVRDSHPAGDDLARVHRAVDLCPSGALSLRDDDGAR